jgi:hypothetical protein
MQEDTFFPYQSLADLLGAPPMLLSDNDILDSLSFGAAVDDLLAAELFTGAPPCSCKDHAASETSCSGFSRNTSETTSRLSLASSAPSVEVDEIQVFPQAQPAAMVALEGCRCGEVDMRIVGCIKYLRDNELRAAARPCPVLRPCECEGRAFCQRLEKPVEQWNRSICPAIIKKHKRERDRKYRERHQQRQSPFAPSLVGVVAAPRTPLKKTTITML